MQDSQIIIFHHYSAFYQTRPKASPTSSVPVAFPAYLIPHSRSLSFFWRSWASWISATGEYLPAKGQGDPVRFSFEIIRLKAQDLMKPGFATVSARGGRPASGFIRKMMHWKRYQESLRLVGNLVAKSPAFIWPSKCADDAPCPCSKKNGLFLLRRYLQVWLQRIDGSWSCNSLSCVSKLKNCNLCWRKIHLDWHTLRSQKPCSKNRVRSHMALVAAFSRTPGSTKIQLPTLEWVWMHMRSVDGWFPWNLKFTVWAREMPCRTIPWCWMCRACTTSCVLRHFWPKFHLEKEGERLADEYSKCVFKYLEPKMAPPLVSRVWLWFHFKFANLQRSI